MMGVASSTGAAKSGTKQQQHVLVSIPCSHYVERARWACDLARVPYRESKWAPMLHYLGTVPLSGTKTVPVLRTPSGEVLSDSSDIVKFAHRMAPSVRLYPESVELRGEVERWEELFSRKLGPMTRVVCYNSLFADRALTCDLLTTRQGLEPWKCRTFRALSPGIMALMKAGMNVNQAAADKCMVKIRKIFAEVEQALGESGQYLVGNSFTAADLTFASMVSILLLPEHGYGAEMPSIEDFPPCFPGRELRATRAGQYALRMYALHRAPPQSRL